MPFVLGTHKGCPYGLGQIALFIIFATMVIETKQQLAQALGDRTMYGMTSREFGELIRREGLWDEAMALACEGGRSGPSGRVAFRAAWSMEAAYFACPHDFDPYIPQFIEDFPQVRNPSVHRHYTKIMRELLRRRAVRLTDEQAEQVAEFCFDRLIGPDTKVAVKVWAADVLMLLIPQLEWIGEHLGDILRGQMEGGSPGMVGHGRKLLARLRR